MVFHRLLSTGRSPIAIWVVVAMTGCNSEPPATIPETFPVTGKVLQGGEPVTSGAVEFRSLQDTTTTATGAIEPDGTFSLSTFVRNEQVDGALPGPHEVTIHVTLDGVHAPRSLSQPQPFVVERDKNMVTFDIGK